MTETFSGSSHAFDVWLDFSLLFQMYSAVAAGFSVDGGVHMVDSMTYENMELYIEPSIALRVEM